VRSLRRARQATPAASRARASGNGLGRAAQHVDHLRGEGDQDLDHVGRRGGDVVLRGVAVEDRRDLVAQDERRRHDALRAAAEPSERLRRARRLARVAARGVARAVGEAEHGVAREGDVHGLDRVGVIEAARVPADGRVVLDDEHGRALGVALDLVHELGEHLGEVGALLDRGDRRLERAVVGARGGRLLRDDFRHRARDRALVDLLVVAGDGLAELVEGAHEGGLVTLDGALDLHHPVRHLLADEG
jgi:hypothetical protein